MSYFCISLSNLLIVCFFLNLGFYVHSDALNEKTDEQYVGHDNHINLFGKEYIYICFSNSVSAISRLDSLAISCCDMAARWITEFCASGHNIQRIRSRLQRTG